MWNLAPSSSVITTQECFSPVKTSLRQFNIATRNTYKTAYITEQYDPLLGIVNCSETKAISINLTSPSTPAVADYS